MKFKSFLNKYPMDPVDTRFNDLETLEGRERTGSAHTSAVIASGQDGLLEQRTPIRE